MCVGIGTPDITLGGWPRGMPRRRMISVVIPALDAEETLAAVLTSLVPAAVEGLVREVIVVDGGSTDRTRHIADAAGAEIVEAGGSRARQLKAGAARAKFPWLLFLNADVELDNGFERETGLHIERVETGRSDAAAAAFRFAIDDGGVAPRVLEYLAAARCAVLRIPRGDQGLLVPRRLYDEIGGYADVPVMEDVDLARRLGRRRIAILRARAIAGAAHYRREGYMRRAAKNMLGLVLYAVRVPLPRIARLYGAPRAAP